MARSKQRTRRSKRRGTQAGTVKQSPRSRGSRTTKSQRTTPEQKRAERLNRPPSWTRATLMGFATAAFLLLAFMVFFKRDTAASVQFALMSVVLYVPIFYFADSLKYQRNQRRLKAEREQAKEGGS